MTERDQSRMLFHGAVVLLIGLLAGIPMGEAITGQWGEDAVRAWRVAHVGVVAAGIMLVAIAPALRLVALGPRPARWLVGAFVASAYGGTVALTAGAILGVRGLEPGHSLANTVVFLGNSVLAVGSLLGAVLLIHGARAALHGRR
jgi:hypothetical protein